MLSFILCPLIETNLRRGLMLTEGSFLAFFAKPIALFFLVAAVVALMLPLVRTFRSHRAKAAGTAKTSVV